MAAKLTLSTKDMNTLRVVNAGNAVAPQDLTTLSQLTTGLSAQQAYTDAAVAGLASGQILKGAVRAAVSTNINLAAPGATLDGLAANPNEIFLLTGQTTGLQNGPYVFNGAAVPMTRAPNWDTAGEAVVGSYWIVAEGSQADKIALMTNDTFTLNTTTATFKFFNALAGNAYETYSTTTPAISAGGTGTITHNLNTRKVTVTLIRVASPYDEVDIRAERTTVNTVSLLPDVAVASGEYDVLVTKVP